MGDRHDTALSSESPLPGALGLATSDHTVPFHCSIRVTVGPGTVWAEPTATQKVTEVHDTP